MLRVNLSALETQCNPCYEKSVDVHIVPAAVCCRLAVSGFATSSCQHPVNAQGKLYHPYGHYLPTYRYTTIQFKSLWPGCSFIEQEGEGEMGDQLS